jgi:hypothetical protein
MLISSPQKNMDIRLSGSYSFAIVVLLLTFNISALQAQDTLITKNKLEVRAVNRNGALLKFKDLIAAAKAEELPEAEKHFKKARVYDIVGNVIGLPGAFILGYSLGYGLTSPKGIDGKAVLLGAGLIAAQYTFVATLRDPQMREGIRLYNEALYQKRKRTVANEDE